MIPHNRSCTRMRFYPVYGVSWMQCAKGWCIVDNVKYTLYAKQGRTFRSGLHILYIGKWLQPDMSKYVVLVHGVMSRNEYNILCTRRKLPIYEYAPVSWVNIFPYLENGFFRIQRIGCLYKSMDPDIWKGGLKHNGWH